MSYPLRSLTNYETVCEKTELESLTEMVIDNTKVKDYTPTKSDLARKLSDNKHKDKPIEIINTEKLSTADLISKSNSQIKSSPRRLNAGKLSSTADFEESSKATTVISDSSRVSMPASSLLILSTLHAT